MSSQQRVRRFLMAPSFWLIVLGAAPAVAEEIRDWPCDAPLAERFDPVQVWGRALAAPAGRGLASGSAVREVVEFAANPENPPGQGAKRIAAFAAPLGADREERLLMVFAGLLDQFNLLRGFVIEGVRDFVLRAKILREAVEQNEAALAALPTEGGPGEEQRRGYLEARSWDARQHGRRPGGGRVPVPPLWLSGQEAARTDRRHPSGSLIRPGAGHRAATTGEVSTYAQERLVAVDGPGLRPGPGRLYQTRTRRRSPRR